MCRAAPRCRRSQLVQRLAGELVELTRQTRVGRAGKELLAQTFAGEPACPMAVRNDVGDRLPVDGQDKALASLHCVDDLARVVSQGAYTVPQVLPRSTTRRVFARRGSGGGATRIRASSTV